MYVYKTMSCATASQSPPACVPDNIKPADCSICLESCPHSGSASKCSTCEHFFHKSCIQRWLQDHTTCPLCRSPMRPQPKCYLVEMRSDGMIYHWDPSDPDQASVITWGMPPLGTMIEPGHTWWESPADGEIRSDTVVWEIFQSIIAVLAVEEGISPSDAETTASTRVSWLLAS